MQRFRRMTRRTAPLPSRTRRSRTATQVMVGFGRSFVCTVAAVVVAVFVAGRLAYGRGRDRQVDVRPLRDESGHQRDESGELDDGAGVGLVAALFGGPRLGLG